MRTSGSILVREAIAANERPDKVAFGATALACAFLQLQPITQLIRRVAPALDPKTILVIIAFLVQRRVVVLLNQSRNPHARPTYPVMRMHQGVARHLL